MDGRAPLERSDNDSRRWSVGRRPPAEFVAADTYVLAPQRGKQIIVEGNAVKLHRGPG